MTPPRQTATKATRVLTDLMIRAALQLMEVAERRQALRNNLTRGLVSHPSHYLPASHH